MVLQGRRRAASFPSLTFPLRGILAHDPKIGFVRSGDIKLPSLQTGTANISIHGSGDVYAAGVADKVDVEIMGSGDVRTRKLISREANVKIMASGDAEVNAREKLTATVSGSGEVRFAGSPATVSRTIRGSGTIESL